jgi:uncharacterized protein
MIHAMRGEIGECKHLIVQGANMELTNKLGETPLLIAISRGNFHSVIELLKGHANMHHRNKVGLNALHVAIASGQSTLVEALLNYDASWRKHPMWSPTYHHPPLADVTLPTGQTPLMMCSQDNEDVMLKSLLEHNASVNLRSKTGETALMYASITGYINIVKILLRFKADPAAQNDLGFTPVMMAANRGHIEVINRFIVHDEDFPDEDILDTLDSAGHCALDHAILSDETEVAIALMAAGAKMQIFTNVGAEVLMKRKASLTRKAAETKRIYEQKLLDEIEAKKALTEEQEAKLFFPEKESL